MGTAMNEGTQPSVLGQGDEFKDQTTSGTAEASESGMRRPPKQAIGMGAGVLLAGGAAAGAWLYQHRQAERRRAKARLRRGAQAMTSRVGMRLKDRDELPGVVAPVGGATTALLLSALLVARAVQRAAPALTSLRTAALESLQEVGRGRAPGLR